jgi:hypothetical protein
MEVMKLEGEREQAFARLALSILEGNFLEVLKLTPIVADLGTCTDLRRRRAMVIALFEAAHVITREQLGLPPLSHLPSVPREIVAEVSQLLAREPRPPKDDPGNGAAGTD